MTSNGFHKKLESIVTKYGLNMPKAPSLTLNGENLIGYIPFAKRINQSLELFRMRLRDHFTNVHLWPGGFDFSVESFINENNGQIGVGVSPGDDSYESPYLYVNPTFQRKYHSSIIANREMAYTGLEWNKSGME